MGHPTRIAALFLALAVGARAEDQGQPHVKTAAPAPAVHATVHAAVDTGFLAADLALGLLQLGLDAAIFEHEMADAAPPPVEDSWGKRLEQQRQDDYGWRGQRPRQHDSREGLMFSFGLGGGSFHTSDPYYGGGRQGAFDLDFRLGYGFSDRFQLFGDLGLETMSLRDGSDLTSWTLTLRGQTVLIGDRQGNGLNVNFGIGLGGLSNSYGDTYYDPYYDSYDRASTSTPAGLAVAGGLSYDARLGPHFALSPELFYVWHQIPNDPGFSADVANTWGLRLNLLWYIY